ncbi:hypothetical protein [Nostoc sp.]|uniref:hypothetical protein n=1 Tax=Nostoc sp. TaxID=1180 RepID=UPI002FF8D06F
MSSREKKKSDRGKASEQEIELQNRQQTGDIQGRSGDTQRKNSNIRDSNILLTASPGPSNQQTQTTQQKDKSKGKDKQLEVPITEVEGKDFNKYMTLESIDARSTPVDQKHELGHTFAARFVLQNTTSEKLLFTSPPLLEWNEIISQKENKNGTEGILETKPKTNQYALNPNSHTFSNWHEQWKIPVEAKGTKEIYIQDVPRVRNIEDQNRTIFRSVEFDIGVAGSSKRVKAIQRVEAINGRKEQLSLDIN